MTNRRQPHVHHLSNDVRWSRSRVKFCAECGGSVVWQIPPGDHLPRDVCASCGLVHYQNPRIVAGCVAEWEGRILLCRRAIEPRLGLWTLPAGYMENGETVQECAAREAREESLADIEVGSLMSVVNVLCSPQVTMLFRARLRNPKIGIGAESLEVKLVDPRDIPWDRLAFVSVQFTLERYLSDRAQGVEGVHFHTID